MRVMVTGGAGFIGSHFCRVFRRRYPEARLVVLDALTYAGNLANLEDFRDDRNFAFHPGRIQDRTVVEGILRAEGITHIVDFAAESHNDRSIQSSAEFIETNVLGVYTLLEATRRFAVQKYVHVSTDEVYGSIESGDFTEESPLEPNTPYSASKAGGDLLVRAYCKAFGVPAVITRGGNTYGPYQYPEKLIPFFATRLLEGKKVPIYGDGTQVREWIHAEDHASGVLKVLEDGQPGEVYNIGDENERQNREVVSILLDETGRDWDLVKSIPDPRKNAHDRRYSMSSAKLRKLGWKPEKSFEEEIRNTVRWYAARRDWWEPIVRSADYQEFVRAYYGPSLGEDL